MKKVLIAHQSSIPHYRVDFYNSLKDLSSPHYQISIVKDSSVKRDSVFFKEVIDYSAVHFNIHYTRTFFLSKSKKYCLQTFLFSSWRYDLIIVENAINNLSYPLAIIYKLFGKKVAFWGHGRDLNNPGDDTFKRKVLESIKLFLIRQSDGFFAYTDGVKDYLVTKNVEEGKIFTVNNTIDIHAARRFKYAKLRDKLHHRLVFTGRLTKSKRIKFLIESFKLLYAMDNRFELVIIGDGTPELQEQVRQASKIVPIKTFGSVTSNEELAKIYSTCDLYVYPGYVGLGALHAMCFDLIPVVLKSEFHKPEFDYLNEKNAYILGGNCSEEEYAIQILDLYKNPNTLLLKRKGIWSTISHLTTAEMAANFSNGIKKMFDASI